MPEERYFEYSNLLGFYIVSLGRRTSNLRNIIFINVYSVIKSF
jgi:hypothetical protein